MASNGPTYVCFEGKAFADKQALSGRFYSTLQKLVVQQPGFISETPFVSIDQPGAQLLYVKFDNEQHMRDWANQRTHLKAQSIGRAQVFSDYRIRIGYSVRDSKEDEGIDGSDSATAGQYLLVWQYPFSKGDGEGLSQPEVKFDGVSLRHLVDAATYANESHGLQISAWSSREAAMHVEQNIPRVVGDEVRIIMISRDYGKFNRREAPTDVDEGQCKAAADEGVVLPMAQVVSVVHIQEARGLDELRDSVENNMIACRMLKFSDNQFAFFTYLIDIISPWNFTDADDGRLFRARELFNNLRTKMS